MAATILSYARCEVDYTNLLEQLSKNTKKWAEKHDLQLEAFINCRCHLHNFKYLEFDDLQGNQKAQ